MAAGVSNLGLRDRKSICFSSLQPFKPQCRIRQYVVQSEREALRWVQRHIAIFGGDPAKVTLFVDSLPSCF